MLHATLLCCHQPDFATYVTIVRKLDIWSCSECSVALIWCLSPIRILESWTQQSHSKERRNRNSCFWLLEAVTRAATTVGIVIGTHSPRPRFSAEIQGVPKKMSFSGKTAITTFKLIQNTKVGSVLENSGYLLHHGHWDFQNWRRNDWENEA